jgi:4-aminobutyrate aminotransferase-like enzyme/Ser/Thr protein kinase RdoA (MazF antagonist)
MPELGQAPRFDVERAQALARECYGLEAMASPLESERDQNVRLDLTGGTRYVLKIANAGESREWLEAQNAAMAHAAARGAACPSVVAALDGATIATTPGDAGAVHLVRLLTWIPGEPLGRVRYHSPRLLEDLGRTLGALDAALGDFDHPAIHRDFHWDLARASGTIAQHAPLIEDVALRSLVQDLAVRSAVEVEGASAGLPAAAIHNDPNDYNVIVARDAPGAERIAGVVDFGDMVHGWRAADPAIAIAYAMLDAPDPLGAARRIADGYHAACPLTEAEAGVLFDLAILRLCLSAAVAASQVRARPDDPYLAISQAPIARTLPALAAIPRGFASAAMRQACGFEANPASARIERWLHACEVSAVIDVDPARLEVLDLSVGSSLVAGDPEGNAEPVLTARVDRFLGARGATSGIGRYLEPRILYMAPLFEGADQDAERRTIHLGIDLFVPTGTAVRAPLEGTVALAADNAAPLDYGPVIILEHRTADDDRFFTLYGHLTRESLAGMAPGRRIAAGEAFAAVGAADVNGGWTPHLHLQVIVDLLGLGTDFPGVCRASELPIWRSLSPSANALLRLAGGDFPPEELDPDAALAARQGRIGPSVRVAYREPLKIARGWMQHLFDWSGRRYLDAYNNVPHVGHSQPRVAEAAAAQIRVLNTNTRYLQDALEAYAERLTATLPHPLRVCYFVNSGTEANELALRLARAHTRRQDVLVLDAAYHGHSTTMIDVSPYKFNGPGGQGARPWVHVAALPDVYRGPYRREGAGAKYARDVGVLLAHLGPGRLAAFLAETCPSVAGQILLPDRYLAAVYEHVRGVGGLCIADEVQTAYGRMGSHFYAFEAHGVVPDIVVLGKPIGNGYPLGAVVTTREIAESFDNGMEFFSTFGGSTVSCAVGLAVLDVVEEQSLQAHAQRVGERLGAGLREIAQRHALVGDVRGSGFFWGIELVTDRATLAPAAAEASYVVNRLRDEGILIGTDGPAAQRAEDPAAHALRIRGRGPAGRDAGSRDGGTGTAESVVKRASRWHTCHDGHGFRG